MSAYEDGYYSNVSTPPSGLSASDQHQWERGRNARKSSDYTVPTFGTDTGSGGLGLIFLIILAFIYGGVMVLWGKVQHFMEESIPNPNLPLTMISCALIVYWLFKKSKILSIGLLAASLLFIMHWIEVLYRRGFDVVYYNLLGIILSVLLVIGFTRWLIAKVKSKRLADRGKYEQRAQLPA